MHARPRPSRALNEAVFRPERALGAITGAGFTAWAAGAAVLLASIALDSSAGLKTFVAWAGAATLLLLAFTFITWTYSLATLHYTITDDSLSIVWGFRRVVIPIAQVQRMVPGRTLDLPRVSGLNWWGCHVGSAEVKRLGYTLFYSTHNSTDDILYVVTPHESYGLAVQDQAAFAEEVQARAAVTPIAPSIQRSIATGPAALPFWRDRSAVVTAAVAAAFTALLAAYVSVEYASLPQVIQIEFPDLGGIVRVGDKREILKIVYVGLGVLAANVVLGILMHARERAAGLWLLASGGMIQGVLLAAAVLAVQKA